ncbi:MAG TPA: hypothetical protein VN088_19240 [Nocardioides sp.]|nr:hypothetical protein [Nocardioides sp.]
MIGHLGARVSALLDGQLSADEAEEAWRHVYGCHACRDLVEREGWVKSRLAGLAADADQASLHDLKGSLLSLTPGDSYLAPGRDRVARRVGIGAAALGGGAIGAALLGVVALGMAPGSGAGDLRQPVTQVGNPTQAPAIATAVRQRRQPSTRSHVLHRGLDEVVARTLP